MRGVVKWFSDEKGFGFIAPDDGTKDCFAHHTQITDMKGRRTLVEDDRVEFDITPGTKGPQASNIRKL